MRLTPAYKKIQAVFDSPVEFSTGSSARGYEHLFHFNIGPLEYRVRLISRLRDEYSISFRLEGVSGDEEELADYLSEAYGVEFFPGDIENFLERIQQNSYGILGVGNSVKVFATVLQIVKKFVETHNPRCLVFTADEASRQKLYRGLIRRYFPGYTVKESFVGALKFTVCRPEHQVAP